MLTDDGYYCQFLVSVDIQIQSEPTNKTIGLDVGLSAFYTDDLGNKVDNPQSQARLTVRVSTINPRKVKFSYNP